MLRHAQRLVADAPSPTAEAGQAYPAPAPRPSTAQQGIARAERLWWTPRARRLLWASAIAAMLLVSLAGVFAAAADAQPGGALYALRRFEQNVRSQFTTNAADRTQLHLDNAQAALNAFDAAAAQHEHGARLTDALDTFVGEYSAARASLAEVTDSAAHARLAAALDQQRSTNNARRPSAICARLLPLRTGRYAHGSPRRLARLASRSPL
jgi:hypothetical protein